ncbi:MAG TPA: hypothetical protein VGL92_12660, partial [Acidimicrobiia bacterium]
MTAAVALTNVVLGVAYTCYGIITAMEMRRDWRSFGFSHFGAAWIAMAFTCGPHHLAHGIHVGLEGRPGGALDLLAVVVGLPVGVVWLSLRIEAFLGGRGDRFILGEPRWLRAAPVLSALYLAVLAAGTATRLDGADLVGDALSVLPNLLLVGIYMAIGWFIVRTQLRNHPLMGGWSVSGLCLSVIFPTCALMHGVFAVYALAGTYHHDIHGGVIDWLSVPAGAYFLWVVRRLYRDTLRDWNQGPDEVAVPTFSGFTGVELAQPPEPEPATPEAPKREAAPPVP